MKWMIKMMLGLVMFLAFVFVYGYFFKGAPPVWLYADVPGFLFLILLTAVINRINYSIREEWAFFKLAFMDTENDSAEKELLQKGIGFFKHLEGLIYGTAAVISVWAIVSMMANLEDSSSVGPNLATSLLVLLYGVVINILVVRPCRIRLRKRILEK